VNVMIESMTIEDEGEVRATLRKSWLETALVATGYHFVRTAYPAIRYRRAIRQAGTISSVREIAVRPRRHPWCVTSP
jgi:hypothetical protein